MQLENRVIAITGAGSGIGRATAQILAESGAVVVASDSDSKRLAETDNLIRAAGGTSLTVVADVTDERQIANLVETAVQTFGRLDGAFNNAGIKMHNKLTADLDYSEWQRVLRVNLDGIFYCMKHQIPAMAANGGGAIVNSSSMNGVIAIPYSSEYTASKHAVIGATRGAASEASITGVRVNAVLPGLIETPMIDDLLTNPDFQEHVSAAKRRHTIGRFGRPEDVGYAVKWLLSDEASFVNGATIAVDGGYTAT